ncbi:MAG: acyltransferase family protein [Chlorobium sp.]
MKIAFPRNNNLEWLRLLFAVQVVLVHVAEELNIEIPYAINHFPGVPAFFFVSGFLIYASYLNAPGRRYFENRFLRIYPALVLVTLGGGGDSIGCSWVA